MGDVILIPKQLRMEWTDALALDASLSNMAFRVACVIGSHFNRKKGETFLRLDTIARVMGVSERSVWGAIREIEAKGYLLVQRRLHGFHQRKDGTVAKVCGGRGAANVFMPAFQRSQVAATDRGGKLAARCDLIWSERSQNPARKVAVDCDPTLKTPTGSNPEERAGKIVCVAIKPGTSEFEACKKWLSNDGSRPFALSQLILAEELGKEFMADPRWLREVHGTEQLQPSDSVGADLIAELEEREERQCR